MTELPPIQHEKHERGGAFTVIRDGERLAEMTYSVTEDGRIVIQHTAVSEKLKGQGVGKKLVAAGVDWARAENVKLVPVCTFARDVIARTPEFGDVLASR